MLFCTLLKPDKSTQTQTGVLYLPVVYGNFKTQKISGQDIWDLCGTKWHWYRLFLSISVISCQYHPPTVHTHTSFTYLGPYTILTF